MLFHTTFRQRAGITTADQKKLLELWTGWTPPAGFEIKSFYIAADGRGFTVTEVDKAETMYAVTTLWAGVFLDYEVTPIVPVETAVPILAAAIAKRGG